MFKRIYKTTRSSLSHRRSQGDKSRNKFEKDRTITSLCTNTNNNVVIESSSMDSESSVDVILEAEVAAELMGNQTTTTTTSSSLSTSSGCSSSGIKEKVVEEEEGSTASTSASTTCSGGSSSSSVNVLDTVIRYRQMGSEMDDSGNYEKAKEYLEFALSVLQRGRTNSNRNHSDENEEVAKCHAQEQEQEGEICLLLGHIMYKTEDYKGAIQRFSKARDVMLTDNNDDDNINSKLEEITYLIEMAAMMMGD